MKVMQINVVYKGGSTGSLVYDIHKGLLERGIESIVCYGRGENVREGKVYKTASETLSKFNVLKSRITGLQYNGSYFGTNNLLDKIINEKPDIVHLQCINGHFVNIYKLLEFLSENKIRTVVTLHAEFLFTGSCGHSLSCDKWKNTPGCGNCPQLWEATNSYFFDRTQTAWKKMRDAFEDFDKNLVVTSVSPWLMERARESVILANKEHRTIINGIDTNETFRYSDHKWIKEKYNLKNEKIILHVTSVFDSSPQSFKGGWYILELAKRFIKENIKIIVVGSKSEFDMPKNIINVGRVESKRELAAFYSLADLCVLTSKRETFSMVTAEAHACGTPVVGFKAGGPESISLEEFSSFTDYGDTDALETEVLNWINKKKFCYKEIEIAAKSKYSKEKMVDQYFDLYKKMFI